MEPWGADELPPSPPEETAGGEAPSELDADGL